MDGSTDERTGWWDEWHPSTVCYFGMRPLRGESYIQWCSQAGHVDCEHTHTHTGEIPSSKLRLFSFSFSFENIDLNSQFYIFVIILICLRCYTIMWVINSPTYSAQPIPALLSLHCHLHFSVPPPFFFST